MTTKKTRFTTSRERADEQRESINPIVDRLVEIEPATIEDDTFEDLSDLSKPAASRLVERWLEIPYPVRLALTREMASRSETDIEHHYERALVAALRDKEPDVRLVALGGLNETSEPSVLEYLLTHLQDEPDAGVRDAGVEALGQFALQAELAKMPDEAIDRLRDVLLTIAEDDLVDAVRWKAIESAGYLAGDPEVADAISDAWDSGVHNAQVSALRAMGNQCDPRWIDRILAEFQSDEPELRFEAARAAGTVGGQRIVPTLIDLTGDDDVEVQMAAIAALGSIGGDIAVTALRNLEHSESLAVADAATAALDEALLADNAARPPNSLW